METKTLRGARKRKSTTITRIVHNNIESIEPQKITPKPELFDFETNLKEPKERVTLIERALGSFNANNDLETQNNPLNTSVITGPPFTCIECNSWFYLGNKLKLHYTLNHKMCHCQTCGSLFKNEEKRNEHSIKVHSTVQCEICQDELSYNDIWFHYDEDHDAVACTFCGIVLQPKSTYAEHFQKNHKMKPKSAENILETPIITVKTDGMFYCSLCMKPRSLDIFFGHMKSFHKITTTQLMNVLIKQKIELTINGTTTSERATIDEGSEKIVPIQTSLRLFKLSCEICDLRYNDKISAAFHHIYCRRKLQCYYCNNCYETENRRRKHIKKNHSPFSCEFGCETFYDTEEQSNEHNLEEHQLIGCRYCEIFLNPNEFDQHLYNVHNYTAKIMNGFTDTLFEVTDTEKNQFVLCCLCEDNLTPIIDSVKDVFNHFNVNHHVSVKKIIRLITPKPSLDDCEDFYKEINTSIDSNVEFSDDDNKNEDETKKNKKKKNWNQSMKNKRNKKNNGYEDNSNEDTEGVRNEGIRNEGIRNEGISNGDVSNEDISNEDVSNEDNDSDEVNDGEDDDIEANRNENSIGENCIEESSNKENAYNKMNNNKRVGNKKNKETDLSDKLRSEVDTQEVQVVFDSEIDCNQPHTCEICKVENINTLDFLIHLKEKHKMIVKYTEYECKICSELFLNQTSCDKHILSHNNPESTPIVYDCTCGEKPYRFSAREHIVEKHSEDLNKYVDELGYKCRFCGDHFWEKSGRNRHESEQHSVDNNPEFLKCPLCSNFFSDQSFFKRHIETEHPEETGYTHLSYKCLNCFMTFQNFVKLKSHFKEDHPESKLYCCPYPGCYKMYKVAKYINVHLKKPHKSVKMESYQIEPCDVCGIELNSVRSLNVHVLAKHRKEKLGYMCRICKERFQTVEQRKLHCATSHPGELSYVCRECGKGFVSKSGLYGHKKVHIQAAISICPYCNKQFNRRDSYGEHLLIHIGPKHQCPHCPKQFTQRSNLIRHVRIHTGTKPYQCRFCDKKFSDQGAKRSHERVHTKEEHCQCTICGKSFTKRQKLKYHMRFHTGEGLVSCVSCGKQFSSNYALNEHKKIHDTQTLIMCECGRGFSSEKYLQRHQQNVHSRGEPQYTCPICFKQIYRKNDFRDHMIIHAGNKPYSCLICGSASYTKRTTRRHIITKHKIDPKDFQQYLKHSPPSTEDITVNLAELLDDKNLLQVDLLELENVNETTEDVVIKTEPVSDDNEEYVKPKKNKRSVRTSPRNPKVQKHYKTESSGDED